MDNLVVAPIMQKAKQQFLSKNRDLVACVRGGAAEIFERISAEMMLDDEAEDAINATHIELSTDEAGDALTSDNPLVRDFARSSLQHAFLKQISLSYLRLMARGALSYAIAKTQEAEEQEYQLGVDAGCRRPQAIVAPEPETDPVDQVVEDYRSMRSDLFQAKYMSNHRALYDEAISSGRI